MDAKVVRLKQVAQSGDIDAFYTLIREDVQLLEHIDELPFADTPLHIAASAGQIPFALEMMGLKPSFARKLDPNGFSPIHLALQNGHIELVRQLLQLDGDLVRVKGRERLTPLHYVVATGDHHLDLLEEFLLVCPDSIVDVTVQNETALHIALKYDKLEAFQFLVRWLGRNLFKNTSLNVFSVLNQNDDEGNTVLHTVVSKNKTQDVRHLLSRCKEIVDVNHKNLEDNTSSDILREDSREIRDMLRRAEAKPVSSPSTFNGCPNPKYQRLLTVYQRLSTVSWVDIFLVKNLRREIRKMTVEWRSLFIMVAVLLATLSFQAVLTPPGGVWQDNGLCITTEPGSSYHQIPPFNKTIGSSNHPKIIYLSQSNTTLACEHKVGTAIALQDRFFFGFLFCNTLIFTFSNSIIVLLSLYAYFRILFLELTICLCLSYFYSVWTITDDASWTIQLLIGGVLNLVIIQLLNL